MTENIRDAPREVVLSGTLKIEGFLTKEEGTIDEYHESIMESIEKLQAMKTGISPEKWREISENISQLRAQETQWYSGKKRIFRIMQFHHIRKD